MVGSRTNCGEYQPGEAPIPNIPPPTPPSINVIIPGPTGQVIIPDLQNPNNPKWKCILGQDIPCEYQDGKFPDPDIFWAQRSCAPCDGSPGNPNVGEPGCIHVDKKACVESPCVDIFFDCPQPRPGGPNPGTVPPRGRPRRGGGGVYRGPGDIVPPAPGSGRPSGPAGRPVVRPPTTGGGATRYICKETYLACPIGTFGRVVVKTCTPCHQLRDPETNQFYWPANCRNNYFNSLSQCQQSCVPRTQSQCEPAGGFPNVEPGNSSQIQVNVNTELGKLNSQIESTQQKVNINIQEEVNKNVTTTLTNQNNNSFDEKRNFFYPNEFQLTRESKFVPNGIRTDIFSNFVSEEINYILEKQNLNLSWNETILQTLTLEKLAVSLNPNLLKVFNSIHDISNKKVNYNLFLESLRKHILCGTLDEFDVSFYYTLANMQQDDKIKEYSSEENKNVVDTYALRLSNFNKINLEAENLGFFNNNLLKRQKRLNEDINTRTYVNASGYSDSQGLSIFNAGMALNPSNAAETLFAENGIGNGYYLPVKDIDGNYKPLIYFTDSNNFAYQNPAARNEALSLMGEDPSYYITASSSYNVTEFTSGITFSTPYSPLYFKLQLSSVSSTNTKNQLVKEITATYTLLTDQEEINLHTDTYGFCVTRANIDYKDPIYKYIYDTSTLFFKQKDINYSELNNNTAINVGTNIAEKTIPMALIITPTKGSRYNPFNGTSKIDSLENEYVVRTLKLVATIGVKDGEPLVGPLKTEYLVNNNPELKVGLLETPDPQGVTFRFSPSDSWLTDSIDQSTTMPSSFGLSYFIKDTLDNITTNYSNPSSIYWFDAFRRMPMNRFGQLMYDTDKAHLTRLSEGFRNNLKIKNLIKQPSESNYDLLPEDDSVIIKIGDR